MRRALLLAGASVGLMVAAACASSDEEALQPALDAGPQPARPSDGGTNDEDSDSDPSLRDASTCSESGWCMTALPDGDLVLKDIWPLEKRAFAIAESHVLGVKVLEWDDATEIWKYIDDNSQNEYGLGKFAGKIWAPNEDELYFAVSPGLIYRGVRSSPSSPWAWQRDQLEDNSRDTDPARDHGLAYYSMGRGRLDELQGMRPALIPALGVWGSSGEDVYAWYANTIFRRRLETGGAATWVAEYIVEDADSPADTTYIFSASGTGPDDVWFASGRIRYGSTEGINGAITNYACPIVIHKTAEGYRRRVDSVIRGTSSSRYDACGQRPDIGSFEGSQYIPYTIPGYIDAGLHAFPVAEHGLMTNIASAGPNAIIGVFDASLEAFAYVTADDGGLARLNPIKYLTYTSPELDTGPLRLHSVFLHEQDAWISGWGLVLRLKNEPGAWRVGLGLSTPDDPDHDAGAYSVSTTAINGRPLDTPIHQVRGTSTTNLWAIGAKHALHKTTP